MIVQFMDSVTGAAVYVNPAYVVTLRPDPADPDDVSILTVRDGETFRVKGDHQKVAEKLRSALAA
jgi:hypothetical protein